MKTYKCRYCLGTMIATHTPSGLDPIYECQHSWCMWSVYAPLAAELCEEISDLAEPDMNNSYPPDHKNKKGINKATGWGVRKDSVFSNRFFSGLIRSECYIKIGV